MLLFFYAMEPLIALLQVGRINAQHRAETNTLIFGPSTVGATLFDQPYTISLFNISVANQLPGEIFSIYLYCVD